MIAHNVAELLDKHVVLDVEGIDRLYLNAYQPMLQTGGGVVAFFTGSPRSGGGLHHPHGTDESGLCHGH